MDTRTVLLAASVALLAGSVSLNVIQSGKGEGPPPKAPTVAAPGSAAGNRDTCRAELDHCRRENWNVALRAMAAANGSASAGALPPPPPGTPPPANAPTSKTGPGEQDDALTQMARESLRLQWKAAGGGLVAIVLRDIADPAKQESWERGETQAMVNSANMTGTQRERLERDFAPVRTAYASALRDALSKENPDTAAAFAATKTLFASEDQLMSRVSGDEARDKWRSDVLQHRTAMLAVIAALGDQPWDKSSLTWLRPCWRRVTAFLRRWTCTSWSSSRSVPGIAPTSCTRRRPV